MRWPASRRQHASISAGSSHGIRASPGARANATAHAIRAIHSRDFHAGGDGVLVRCSF